MCASLFKDVKLFSGIEVGAFALGVQNSNAFLYLKVFHLRCVEQMAIMGLVSVKTQQCIVVF